MATAGPAQAATSSKDALASKLQAAAPWHFLCHIETLVAAVYLSALLFESLRALMWEMYLLSFLVAHHRRQVRRLHVGSDLVWL